MNRLALCVALAAFAAHAEDETYRDPKTKETLFVAGGPNVSYASIKRSSLRPLKIVEHSEDNQIIKVKFDKSPTIWTLTLDAEHTRIVCESPGEPRQVFERVKIDPQALPGTTASPGTFIKINSPTEGASIYDPVAVFEGEVSENCERVEATVLDAAGDVVKKVKVSDFDPVTRKFSYEVAKTNKNLRIGSMRFRFLATFKDGGLALAERRVSFHEYEGEMAKPVIYLYPRKTQQVSVKVSPEGGVIKSDPAYGEGWTVTATPKGELVTSSGQKATYLFWESGLKEKPAPLHEGFVVKKEDVKVFLEKELTFLGLNERELADFMEFWLPRMTTKPYAAIRFLPRAEIDVAAPLAITPQPDSIIRVLIDFRALDAPVKLKQQKLVAAKRTGFAAVEWGGLLYRE